MKKYAITVNGNKYEVEVEEMKNSKESSICESRVETPKSSVKSVPKVEKKQAKAEPKVVPEGSQTVEAPMPGTVLDILVNEGEEVKAGQVLLILEAMKMENEIVAPTDGKITAINTTKGTSVSTGDPLVSMN